MLILIRKSDSKVLSWNGGNTTKDPLLQEITVQQDNLPEGDFQGMFYNSGTRQVEYRHVFVVSLQREEEKRRQLISIDNKSVRSLRAVLSAIADKKEPDAIDLEFLKKYEEEARIIREFKV